MSSGRIVFADHGNAVDHRIRVVRRGDSERFDILWSGPIALSYVGRYRPDFRFQARIDDVPMPALPTS